MSDKRLGKGIKALIRSEDDQKVFSSKTRNIEKIPLKDIFPNPSQPRRNFNEDALLELSQSIKEKGVITPITVRKVDSGYEIIAGERRWRAAKHSRKRSIPAYIISPKSDAEILEMALIENIQREDLNPIEEAEGYAVLNSKYNLSHHDIAKTIGKKRTTISNALRLLNLPPEIRKSIRTRQITAGHGRAILQKKSISAMRTIWKKIINESLSVRATESLVKPKTKNKKIKKIIIPKGPVRAIENQLIEIFGTKVKLKPAQIGGSIEIVYFSDDDLERIIDLLQSL